MGLICQRCKKAQATVHLLDIVPPNGEKHEQHLCERCAAEEGLTTHQQESISSILEGFVKQSAGVAQAADVSCPHCGMSFREFRSSGLLGCAHDYKVFEKHLSPLIQRAHEGATHHVGRTPARLRQAEPTGLVKLARLRRSLKEAVEIEDYELAARLRDEIKKVEMQQGKPA